MEKETKKKPKKGGAQRLREKRAAELEKSPKNPKQRKISFNDEVVAQAAVPTTSQVEFISLEELLPTKVECVLDSGSSEQQTSQHSNDASFADKEVKFTLPSDSTVDEKLAFVRNHPIQPLSFADVESIPYAPKKLYYRKLANGDQAHRSWLTVKVENREIKSLHCSICIAFSQNSSNFTTGCVDFRHAYQNVSRHENSQIHRESVAAFIEHKQNGAIETLISNERHNVRVCQIQRNVDVLRRVFEIVKHLGKQSLSFRSHGTNESLYNFNDISRDRGNFLETVKLISLFDDVLKTHLQKCIELSESRRLSALSRNESGGRGRGHLVTFLSKTTLNKVIEAVLAELKRGVVRRIEEKKFSIQLDSTQDFSQVNRGILIVRFVANEHLEERLLAISEMKEKTGDNMQKLLQNFVSQHGLKMANTVGMSFSGTGNMRGEFHSLQAQIVQEAPNALQVWFHYHVLNHWIVESCEPADAKLFFGLLNKLTRFIGETCKKADVWRRLEGDLGHDRLKKVQALGLTRWWTPEKTVQKIFGESGSLFLDTLVVLLEIANLEMLNSNVACEAESLFTCLNSFKTILVAHVFLEIFSIFGPVSRYFQTKGFDVVTAYLMIEDTKRTLLNLEFVDVYHAANQFACSMNERVEKSVEINYIFQIPAELKEVFLSRKKRMLGQNAIYDPVHYFRVEVFSVVVNQLVVDLNNWFTKNMDLITDAKLLDPRQFSEVAKRPCIIPPGSLRKISEQACVNGEELRKELISFASLYPSLVSLLNHENNPKLLNDDTVADGDKEAEQGDEMFLEGWLDDLNESEECDERVQQTASTPVRKKGTQGRKGACTLCMSCVHKILYRSNMYVAAYSNLFAVYEYLLTLSFTQVSCESVCGKMKSIKTRLRDKTSETLSEAQMLMSFERELLEEVKFDQVLDVIRQSSGLMNKLLTV